MKSRIGIIGGGGHARELLSLIDDINSAGAAAWEFIGFFDDDESLHGQQVLGYPLIGPTSKCAQIENCSFICGIGYSEPRYQAVNRLANLNFATLIHPSAVVSKYVEIDSGSVICAGAIVTTEIVIGRHTHINRGVNISHNCTLGDFVTVSPGASLSGNVTVEDRVFLGTNCSAIQGVRIRERAVVGAGAAVIKDVAAGTTVVGVPAKPVNLKS